MTWFFFAVISSFFSSLTTLVEKKTLENTHSIEFSLVLAFFSALLFSPVFIFENFSQLSLHVVIVAYLISLVATIAYLEVIKGTRHLEISTSSPLFLLGPFMTAIAAFIFLDESLTQLQLGGMALLAIGTYILETRSISDVKGFIDHLFGNRYSRIIILGVLLYSLTAVADRIMLHTWAISPFVYVEIVQIFIAVNFTILTLFLCRSLKGALTVAKEKWKIISFAALLTISYRLAQSEATALAAVSLVIAIKRSSSLFTTIIGGELFHETGLMRKSIACTIMIAGVTLIAIK